MQEGRKKDSRYCCKLSSQFLITEQLFSGDILYILLVNSDSALRTVGTERDVCYRTGR